MKFAPIALFVYNRPEHTFNVVRALSKNFLSNESTLYIFSDAAKTGGSKIEFDNVARTREVIKKQKWCKEVIIIEQDSNLGLSKSIINGVTGLINQFDSIIVLEDDVVPEKGFLKYMNDALTFYETNDKVGCIHGWNYNLDLTGQKGETFFLRGADCWGWATWKRAWNLFDSNGVDLLDKIKSKKLEYSFNRNGTHSFVSMLEDQIAGKNDSWAIRWHASLFLNNMFCLQPVSPIVKNIGLDGSGIHSGSTPILQIPVDYINVNRIDVEETKWFFKGYKKMIRGSTRLSIWQILKSWVKKYCLP